MQPPVGSGFPWGRALCSSRTRGAVFRPIPSGTNRRPSEALLGCYRLQPGLLCAAVGLTAEPVEIPGGMGGAPAEDGLATTELLTPASPPGPSCSPSLPYYLQLLPQSPQLGPGKHPCPTQGGCRGAAAILPISGDPQLQNEIWGQDMSGQRPYLAGGWRCS